MSSRQTSSIEHAIYLLATSLQVGLDIIPLPTLNDLATQIATPHEITEFSSLLIAFCHHTLRDTAQAVASVLFNNIQEQVTADTDWLPTVKANFFRTTGNYFRYLAQDGVPNTYFEGIGQMLGIDLNTGSTETIVVLPHSTRPAMQGGRVFTLQPADAHPLRHDH